MAVEVRTRRLSNPSKRRSKNPKRRMSLAQKLHFGTARQRAAARLSLKGRKNPGYKKMRKRGQHMTAQYRYRVKSKLSRGGYTSNPRRKKRVKNIGEIVSISLAGLNPGKKRRKVTMAAHRRRRRKVNAGTHRRRTRRANPARTYRRRKHHTVARRRRSNPGMHRRRRRNPVYAMRRINRGRRRNPSMAGVTSGTIGKALGVIGGAIGSKYLTQLALGGNNTGIMGYGGNLVASIALGWAAGKVTKSKDFGTMVAVGGIAALVLRVLSDNTSIGQYVNLSLSGAGKGGDLGLGIIQDSSFPVPQVAAPGSMTSFLVPRQTRMAISAQAAQTASMKTAGSSGMGRMQGRMARRAIM
jgi:hypothetical protein